MPLSRRELLISLGSGIAVGPLLAKLEKTIQEISIDGGTLQSFDNAHAGFQAAARTLPPVGLIDGLTGHIAILDGLRRRTTGRQRQDFTRMQARYAETLSWLSEEAGDLGSAMYWIDRASQWGHAANWQEMSAYGFVRRSMVAISFASDGRRAVDSASAVLEMRDASPRIRGLAAKQMAFGYALTGDEPASSRALDRAMSLLSGPRVPVMHCSANVVSSTMTFSQSSGPHATSISAAASALSQFSNHASPHSLLHQSERPQ